MMLNVHAVHSELLIEMQDEGSSKCMLALSFIDPLVS